MKVRVLFFASLREHAGVREIELTLESGHTAGDLWETLVNRFPAIEPIGASVSFAVNREYAERSQRLSDGDEVALIPPVSGGAALTGPGRTAL